MDTLYDLYKSRRERLLSYRKPTFLKKMYNKIRYIIGIRESVPAVPYCIDCPLVTFDADMTARRYLIGMVKNNNGRYYSNAQRAAMQHNAYNVREFVDESITRMFLGMEWVYRYQYTFRFGTKLVLVNYMLIGDEYGVWYKLKQATRREKADDIGNGYIIVWARQ